MSTKFKEALTSWTRRNFKRKKEKFLQETDILLTKLKNQYLEQLKKQRNDCQHSFNRVKDVIKPLLDNDIKDEKEFKMIIKLIDDQSEVIDSRRELVKSLIELSSANKLW